MNWKILFSKKFPLEFLNRYEKKILKMNIYFYNGFVISKISFVVISKY